MFEKVYMCNFIIMLSEFYQLGSHISHIGCKSLILIVFLTIKNSPNACGHITCRKIRSNDYMQFMFVS